MRGITRRELAVMLGLAIPGMLAGLAVGGRFGAEFFGGVVGAALGLIVGGILLTPRDRE